MELPRRAERLLDPLTESGQLAFGDRPSLTGLPHTGDHLVPVEWFDDARSLDHHQLGLLYGGEAPLTRGALTTATNACAVLTHAGIEHA